MWIEFKCISFLSLSSGQFQGQMEVIVRSKVEVIFEMRIDQIVEAYHFCGVFLKIILARPCLEL